MRAAATMLAAGLLFAGAAYGQQQTVTLQMQCHDLGSTGFYMQSNESYVNGMACRTVSQSVSVAPASAREAVTVAQTQPFAAAPTYAYASAPLRASGTVRAQAPLVPSVFIEPMQGMEGLLATAFEKKHVPLAEAISADRATYVLHLSWGDASAEGAKDASKSSATPTLQLINRSSGAVVFAYPLNRENTWHGERFTAEIVASQVKRQVASK
ncbi:MAG: hypothetical protein WA192_14520 [Candidatus Acidiferrales bacterium]